MQIRRRRRRFVKKGPKQLRTNNQIRIPEVNLIDKNGVTVGVIATAEAIKRAEEAGLDLVEVDPTKNPSIAKIMDWGQIKYERDKKEKKTKASQKKSEIKGIRLTFRIKGHDLETRIKQAHKFLDQGNKVKFETILKGREKAHRRLAIENLKKIVEEMGEDVEIVNPISTQGGNISVTLEKKSKE